MTRNDINEKIEMAGTDLKGLVCSLENCGEQEDFDAMRVQLICANIIKATNDLGVSVMKFQTQDDGDRISLRPIPDVPPPPKSFRSSSEKPNESNIGKEATSLTSFATYELRGQCLYLNRWSNISIHLLPCVIPLDGDSREFVNFYLPLSVETSQRLNVCRLCGSRTGPDGNDNPFVLKFGEEFAHQHCLDQQGKK